MSSILFRRMLDRPRPFRHSLLLAIVPAAILGLLAAAPVSTTGPLTQDEADLVKIFGGAVEVSTSSATIDRKRLLDSVLKSSSARYRRFGGDHDGTIDITTGPARRTPAGWPKKSPAPTMIQVPNQSVSWLARTDDTLVMPVQLDLSHSVSVRYDPPEPRVFAGARPEPFKMGVKVYDLQGTGSPEHTGSLRVELVDRGVRRLKTPAGEFDVVMFRSSYRGQIGPADIDDHALLFVSPDHGVVASVEHKDVSALIFYNKDTRTGYALADRARKGS